MQFGSDNWSGAAPEISQALMQHSTGLAPAYGISDLDKQVEELFNTVFERECAVYFVGTGTAANSLAIAATMKPGGIVFCHDEAHIVASEGGGPEFLSGGGRLYTVGGKNGKIDPALLDEELSKHSQDFNHLGQPTLLSITQATEAGTVYTLDEIRALSQVARAHNIPMHMDGARFANAQTSLECSAAEMTWKAGVDMVSFGATKNGCWCAEALLVFNRDLLSHFQFVRKRSGHLFSKTRFISAQLEAYFRDDLWLRLARHSNAMGAKLEEVVRGSNHARLAWETDSNQVFFIAKKEVAKTWIEKGARFHEFPTPKEMTGKLQKDEQLYRLVASFITRQEDIDALSEVMSS